MFAQKYYFVLDRSDSMSGKSIANAKEATKLFIRSLPSGSKFNIISFGSESKKTFSFVTDYTQDTLNQALKDIETFDADLGVQRFMDHSRVYLKIFLVIKSLTSMCI